MCSLSQVSFLFLMQGTAESSPVQVWLFFWLCYAACSSGIWLQFYSREIGSFCEHVSFSLSLIKMRTVICKIRSCSRRSISRCPICFSILRETLVFVPGFKFQSMRLVAFGGIFSVKSAPTVEESGGWWRQGWQPGLEFPNSLSCDSPETYFPNLRVQIIYPPVALGRWQKFLLIWTSDSLTEKWLENSYVCYQLFRNNIDLHTALSWEKVLSCKSPPQPCEVGRAWIRASFVDEKVEPGELAQVASLISNRTTPLLHRFHFWDQASFFGPQGLGNAESWEGEEMVSQTEASSFNSRYAWVSPYNRVCWRPRVSMLY